MYKNIKRYQKYKNIKVDNNYPCARTCDSDCSFTRVHKFRHNFQDTLNPLCCNLLESESVNHFLLLCPIYASQRKILLDSVIKLDAGIENVSNSKLAELLLYGNPLLYSKKVNASILKLTISYLMNTERFDCPLF